MHVEKIDISAIDLTSRSYLCGETTPDKTLEESIKSIGQINPVVLTSKDKNFTIITGWKRVFALKELGKTSVAANVFPFQKERNPDFLYTIYFDNKHRFNDLDKAEVICKFKVLCGFSDDELLKTVLPKLSIKPSKNNLLKFIAVALLDYEIKKLFYDNYFTFEQLVMFSEIEDESYKEIVIKKVFRKFRFNNNETREILREVYEISKRDNISFDKCIENIFSGIGDQANKNSFKKKVKFMRYPNLMKVEKKFKEEAKSLESIKSLNLFHHPYFETNEIELRLKVSSSPEYRESIENLSDADVVDKITELLKLIKEGN